MSSCCTLRCHGCRTGCKSALRTYTWHHVAVFLLTFFSYALFHVTRKSFSNIKSVMQETWSPSNLTKYPGIYPPHVWSSQHFFNSQGDSELFLGYMDTTFLFCYAIGLYVSGFVGDRVNMRYLLSGGMMLSSVMVFMFGSLGPWLRIYNVYYYGIFWGLNGLIQSSGWPTVVAIMGNWFGKSSHGLIFGVWSANASVGNILGALLVSVLLPYGFGYAMMGGSLLLFLGGVVIFLFLNEHPRRVGLSCPHEGIEPGQENKSSESDSHRNIQDNIDIDEESEPLLERKDTHTDTGGDGDQKIAKVTGSARRKGVNFFRAFLVPGVIVYSLSYACLKLVNYSLFFWLPYYLRKRYWWASAEESDRLSTLYDVGGIIGGAIGGIISDRVGRRSPVIVVMLVSAIPALFIYQEYGVTPLTNGILMCIAGIFIGGPANLESSAIAADLGKQTAVGGNTEALATVTGIVDGTGSVGAAIGQTVVAVIQEKTNSWSWVFYFLMAALAGSALFLVDLFIRDVWSFCKSVHQYCTSQMRRKNTMTSS